MVPCKGTGEEVSCDWSHHRISSTNVKVRTTLHVSIIDSGSDRSDLCFSLSAVNLKYWTLNPPATGNRNIVSVPVVLHLFTLSLSLKRTYLKGECQGCSLPFSFSFFSFLFFPFFLRRTPFEERSFLKTISQNCFLPKMGTSPRPWHHFETDTPFTQTPLLRHTPLQAGDLSKTDTFLRQQTPLLDRQPSKTGISPRRTPL